MEVLEKNLGKGHVSFVLTNSQNMKVSIFNLGGIIQSIVLPSGEDVVLGYDTPEEYLQHPYYFGTCIGPYANRISGASFTIGENVYTLDKNDGNHCLHSGRDGIHTLLFDYVIEGDRLVLYSEMNESIGGFPGKMIFEISYKLLENNTLMIVYRTVCDQEYAVNLTNHSYFNLDGVKSDRNCLENSLKLFADTYTVNDSQSIPTGEIRSVEGSVLDFRKGKTLGQDMEDDTLSPFRGFDHNFIVNSEKELKVIAEAEGKVCAMTVRTDCPCVQLYTGNFIEPHQGKDGATYNSRSGFCLETGVYPNAVNQENFPSPFIAAGGIWSQKTIFQFVEK